MIVELSNSNIPEQCDGVLAATTSEIVCLFFSFFARARLLRGLSFLCNSAPCCFICSTVYVLRSGTHATCNVRLFGE